jgi:hypothetical protein
MLATTFLTCDDPTSAQADRQSPDGDLHIEVRSS